MKTSFESIVKDLRNFAFNINGHEIDGNNAYNIYSRKHIEAINTSFHEVYNMKILDIIDLMNTI